jgi:peptidoglycan/LPS O-acetylase OafA/YrhL
MSRLINLFIRTTNSKQFLPEIDGLRFFAIITVVFFHLNTSYVRELGMDLIGFWKEVGDDSLVHMGWWIKRMDLGVKVFFAISGFILSIPFLRHHYFNGKKVNIKDYLYRRLTRLEPPFLVTLLLFFFAQGFLFNQNFVDMLPHFFAGLIYSHVFIYGVPNPINPVTWSLETEAQFYLLLPLVVAFLFYFKEQWVRVVLLIFLIATSIYFRGYTTYMELTHVWSSILVYFVNFATGVVFAIVYLFHKPFFEAPKQWMFDFMSVFAIFGMFWFYKPQAYWLNNVMFNLSVFAFFVGVFKGRIFNWLFTRPFIYLVGGMCYTIYLLHYAMFHFLVKFSVQFKTGMGYWADFGLQFLCLFPILLLICSLFYLAIEKPCMDKNWPSQLLHKTKKLFHYRD